jgi:ribA/ribD-fused uncharacterized protein
MGATSIEERLIVDGYGIDVDPVLFYQSGEAWGYFSNFSRHAIWLPHPFTGVMQRYPTGEHRFQAMKAVDCEQHNYVIESNGPGAAKHRGREIQLRDGWGNSYGDLCFYVMFETVLAKALQNDDVLDGLRISGERPIYEDSPTDDIWGVRYRNAYRGKNLLGLCLMQVRDVVC